MYIRKAFSLVSKNLVLIVPILAISLLSMAIMGKQADKINALNMTVDPVAAIGQISGAIGTFMLLVLITAVILLLIEAGHVNMTKQAVLIGQTDFGPFFPGIKKYFWRLVGQMLLTMAMIIAIIVIICIIAIAFFAGSALNSLMNNGNIEQVASSNIGIIIAVIAIIIGLIVGSLFLTLWTPAMVIDDIGVFEGLRRGAKAVAKHFWGILGALILFGIISGIISAGTNALYAAITGNSIADIPTFNYMSVLGMLINSYFSAAMTAYIFTVYHHHRPSGTNPQPIQDNTVTIQPVNTDQVPPEPFEMPEEKQ